MKIHNPTDGGTKALVITLVVVILTALALLVATPAAAQSQSDVEWELRKIARTLEEREAREKAAADKAKREAYSKALEADNARRFEEMQREAARPSAPVYIYVPAPVVPALDSEVARMKAEADRASAADWAQHYADIAAGWARHYAEQARLDEEHRARMARIKKKRGAR